MEYIKIAKIEHVCLEKDGSLIRGILQLTTNHMIFIQNENEDWFPYSTIHSAALYRPPKNDIEKGMDKDREREYLNLEHAYETHGHGSTTGDSFTKLNTNTNSNSNTDELKNYAPTHILSEWKNQGMIEIRTYDFNYFNVYCASIKHLHDLFWTIKHQTCKVSLDQLYAFDSNNTKAQSENVPEPQKWYVYDVYKEFERMGIETIAENPATTCGRWRFTTANKNFEICPTYPDILVVPSGISDTTLVHASKHRSKRRLPVLCYYYKPTGVSISRSSQPMVGLKQARSVQDEKLVECIFQGSKPGATNVIVDARPTTNAVANRAVGAGSENTSHYKGCRKNYLGIDNIHVMRSSINKLSDAIKTVFDGGPITSFRFLQAKSEWLGHLNDILAGANDIVSSILNGENVLVHCSDGWDRTAQLTSLSQLCLDPYYRTIEGLLVLIEKEWVSFGHQFTTRNGHIGIESRFNVVNSKTNFIQAVPYSNMNISAASHANDYTNPHSNSNNDNAGNLSPTVNRYPSPPQHKGDSIIKKHQFDLSSSSSALGRFASLTFTRVQSKIASAINGTIPKLGDADVTNASFDLENRRRSNGSIFGGSKANSETCPVFTQFLDCVAQLLDQNSAQFEFSTLLLLDLAYHVNSCEFGTFLGDSLLAKTKLKLETSTPSLFTHILANKSKYINPNFVVNSTVISVDTTRLKLWQSYYLQHLIEYKIGSAQTSQPTTPNHYSYSLTNNNSSNNGAKSIPSVPKNNESGTNIKLSSTPTPNPKQQTSHQFALIETNSNQLLSQPEPQSQYQFRNETFRSSNCISSSAFPQNQSEGLAIISDELEQGPDVETETEKPNNETGFNTTTTSFSTSQRLAGVSSNLDTNINTCTLNDTSTVANLDSGPKINAFQHETPDSGQKPAVKPLNFDMSIKSLDEDINPWA